MLVAAGPERKEYAPSNIGRYTKPCIYGQVSPHHHCRSKVYKDPNVSSVELLYEKSCPFVEAARFRLAEAFRQVGRAPEWAEWEASDPTAPDHARSYGSPAILVDGKDIASIPAAEAGHCCRIYDLQGESRGAPPLDLIVSALSNTKGEKKAGSVFRSSAALLPSIGAALLPKLTCPVCWPAYAGLLSSLGIGFVDYTPYLLPLTAIFLAISLVALAYKASARQGYAPSWLGAASAITILVGKFAFDSDFAMYAGIGGLVAASIWNSWPRPKRTAHAPASCPACPK